MSFIPMSGGLYGITSEAPNTNYTNASMANNATASITVTQKPRFIVFYLIATSSYSGMCGIYDVEKNKGIQYASSSSTNTVRNWSSISSYITSVTSSKVNIKNSWGYTCRVVVGIYY